MDIFRRVKKKQNDPNYDTYIATKSSILTNYLDRKFNNDNQLILEEISKIKLRKENVVFLRKFDTDCCRIKGDKVPSKGKRKRENEKHDDFIEELNIVIEALTKAFSSQPFETPGKKKDRRKADIVKKSSSSSKNVNKSSASKSVNKSSSPSKSVNKSSSSSKSVNKSSSSNKRKRRKT